MFEGFKTLLCCESALLPFMIFALTKIIVPTKNGTNILIKLILHIVQVALTFIALLFLFSMLVVFAFYFEIITLVAKYFFGEDFYANVIGPDVAYSFCTPQCKNIIHVVKFLRDGPEVPEKMLELFRDQKRLDKMLRNHPSLSCVRKSFMGYTFLVQTTVNYEDIVRYFDDYTTLEEFQKISNRVTKTDLPYDGEYIWEVLIGRKPIQIHSGELHYPIMFRFHHSVTDGMGLSALLMSSFVKDGMGLFQAKCDHYNHVFTKCKKSKKPGLWIEAINKCLELLNKVVYYHFDMVNADEQANALKGRLTGDKIITYSSEVPGERLIEKIKTIKNAFQVSFDDVILGAVTATLSEYFEMRGGDLPTEVTTVHPYIRHPQKLNDIVYVNDNGEPVTRLGNNFVVSVVELPVDVNLMKTPERIITKIQETTQDITESMDFTLFHWVLNVFLTIAPGYFAKIAIDRIPSTVIITSLPGVKKFSFLNECCTEDMVVWSNHMENTGVAFAFVTFDDLLRLTVHVDRGIIDNVQEVQALGDGVLQYIKTFYSLSQSF